MRPKIDEIRELGAELVAVGNGTVLHANWFIKDQRPDFPVYTDPSLKVYEAAGLQRGVLAGSLEAGVDRLPVPDALGETVDGGEVGLVGTRRQGRLRPVRHRVGGDVRAGQEEALACDTLYPYGSEVLAQSHMPAPQDLAGSRIDGVAKPDRKGKDRLPTKGIGDSALGQRGEGYRREVGL